MYRYLEIGELIQVGDEYFSSFREAWVVVECLVGDKVSAMLVPIRRRI